MNLTVIAQIHAKPEFSLTVVAALHALVGQTRKEASCLRYDLVVNLEDENHFTMFEVWDSQVGFNKHNQMDYIKKFVLQSKKWLSKNYERNNS